MGFVEPLQALLKRLALVAMGLSTASAVAIGGELAGIPERAVEAVIDDSEDAGWDKRDRLRVLRLLALDPRESVRRHVAVSMATQPDARHADESEAVVGWLAGDASAVVRSLAATDLVALLGEQSPLERTELVCRWATDADEDRRLILAHALGAPLEINGRRTALEHLAQDDSEEIRSTARRALGTTNG